MKWKIHVTGRSMYYNTLRRIGGEILACVTYFENARALLIFKMVANMWSLVPNMTTISSK